MAFRNHIVTHDFPGLEMETPQGNMQDINLKLVIDTRAETAALQWKLGNQKPKQVKVDNPVAECVIKAFRGGALDSKRSRRYLK